MANFYAIYPASQPSSVSVATVQGEGTPGSQTGGVLTVQGDPSGTPVPVSGSLTVTNPSVSTTGSAVPASGTYVGMNVSGNLTGITGTANGLKVDGSAVNQPVIYADATATGSITSTQSVSISTIGYATVAAQVTGTFTGTIFVEWSPDNVNWYNTTVAVIQTGALALTFTSAGAGTIQCSGAAAVRLRGGSVATGTAVVYLRANATTGNVMLDNPLPTGSNTIGAVNQASAPWTVTGTGTAGSAAAGVLTIQGIASMTPVKVDPSGGTGAVNVTQFGGNNVVTGTGTSGLGIPRVTVSNDSVVGLAAGSNTIGSVNQASAPWTVTGTGSAGSAASGVVTIQGIASMTPVKVDPSGGTGAVDVTQFGGSNVVTGTGASGAGIPRVTVSNDSTVGIVAGTAIIGKVGIDQTTPGTTNAIQATSGTTATWQAEGAIAAGSITTSFATIFTPSSGTKIIFARNNTNQPVAMSMDAGTTQNFVLDAGDQVAIDFIANGLQSGTSAIQIKYTGSAPTTGSFRVNGCH